MSVHNSNTHEGSSEEARAQVSKEQPSSDTRNWQGYDENWGAREWRKFLSDIFIEYETQAEFKGKCPVGLLRYTNDMEEIERRFTDLCPAFVELLERYEEPEFKNARIRRMIRFVGDSEDDEKGVLRAQRWNENGALLTKSHVEELKNAIRFFENKRSKAGTTNDERRATKE